MKKQKKPIFKWIKYEYINDKTSQRRYTYFDILYLWKIPVFLKNFKTKKILKVVKKW